MNFFYVCSFVCAKHGSRALIGALEANVAVCVHKYITELHRILAMLKLPSLATFS